MWSDALILFRKEAGNVLRDRGAVFANYLLPLVLMPLIFGVLGSINKVQEDSHRQTVYHLAFAGGRDAEFERMLAQSLQFVGDLAPGDPAGLTVTFAPGHTTGQPGKVEVAFDSSRQDLSFAGQMVLAALDRYNRVLAADLLAAKGLNPEVMTPLQGTVRDLAAPEVQGSQGLAFLLPYMILLMLFAGSMSLGLAVTTGEKEKGSLASLLVNQVSRTSIAVGKILFVLASAVVNALTSAVGVLGGLYLQSQLGGSGPLGSGSLGALSHWENFAVLAVSVVVASVLAASIIVVIGVRAKTMKEAGGYIMPVYLLVIVGAVAGSSLDASSSFWLHLVPLLNTALVIKASILGSLQPLTVLMALAVNVAAGALLVGMTARAFESEAVLNTV
ncbi:MAG: ABC transporter permease subunit [Spirochaetales bacterium]